MTTTDPSTWILTARRVGDSGIVDVDDLSEEAAADAPPLRARLGPATP
jgi:hypothetical protein